MVPNLLGSRRIVPHEPLTMQYFGCMFFAHVGGWSPEFSDLSRDLSGEV